MTEEQSAQRRGLITILALAVLTVVEYLIAIGLDEKISLVVLLSAIALAKAGAIFWVFMHIAKLWRGEEEHA